MLAGNPKRLKLFPISITKQLASISKCTEVYAHYNRFMISDSFFPWSGLVLFLHYRLKIKTEHEKLLYRQNVAITKQYTSTLISDKSAVGFKPKVKRPTNFLFVFTKGTQVINQPDRLLEKY